MIKADFHLHTEYSPDSIAKLEDLYQKAQKIGLGKLIITDHNTIAGAVKIQRKYPDFVVIGEEILTTSGEILAYFVQEEIPEGLEPIEALKRLKDQGAFISLAHPYAFMIDRLESLLDAGLLDAVELVNGDLGDRPQNFPKFTRCPRRIRLADNRSPASWGRRKAGGCGRRPGQGPRWRGRSPRRAWRGSRLAGCASRE
ncbi:MAG TPA: PHP domain-containing protein [Flexilinea sp.]|nr:PHP domain-containing protein [Flexilinea sp.]